MRIKVHRIRLTGLITTVVSIAAMMYVYDNRATSLGDGSGYIIMLLITIVLVLYDILAALDVIADK